MATAAPTTRSHSFSGTYGSRHTGAAANRLASGKENRGDSLERQARISELDNFILTRYDPLLQIVKQLTARVHEVEATQVAETQKLENLHGRVVGHSVGFEKFAAIVQGLQDYSDRLSRLETALQSQSPMAGISRQGGTNQYGSASPEACLLDGPHNSTPTGAPHSSLSTAVGSCRRASEISLGAGASSELRRRTSEAMDGSAPSSARFTDTDCGRSSASGSEDVPRLPPRASPSPHRPAPSPHRPDTENCSAASQQLGTLEEDTMAEPWLFKVSSAVPITTVASTLSYGPEGTLELDARRWATEIDMWHEIATGLESTPGVPHEDLRPLLLSTDADAPYAAAMGALACACQGEVLIVVRGMPSRSELRDENQSDDANSSCGLTGQARIRCVAKLAVEAQRQWENLERSKPVEELGRLAMVLVGDGIGNSLRAGNKKFPIDPLL